MEDKPTPINFKNYVKYGKIEVKMANKNMCPKCKGIKSYAAKQCGKCAAIERVEKMGEIRYKSTYSKKDGDAERKKIRDAKLAKQGYSPRTTQQSWLNE